MTEEIQSKALDMIQQLAEKMGVAVDQLWATLIMQAKVEAISDIVWIVIMFIPFIISLIIYLNIAKKRKEMEKESNRIFKEEYPKYNTWSREIYVDYEEKQFFSGLIVGFFSFTLLLSMIAIQNIITNLINPNMYAIKYLTNIIQ